MGKRAVILDVDGTLVDTNYQHAIAWYMAFREHDVIVPVWRIHRHLGMGGDQIVAALGGDEVEKELGDELRSAHDALYLASIQMVSALEGASELLREIKEAGCKLILASSAKPQEIEHYVDLLDAREVVDGWTTAEDVERTKPHPDLVLAALERLGADAGEAIMVGDTPWDVEAASKAGVPTVAVRTGGFSIQELEDAGAIAVHESIAQTREHLDELVGGAKALARER
jgi:HAD superfamily hydrolase (TIGR01509 family)